MFRSLLLYSRQCGGVVGSRLTFRLRAWAKVPNGAYLTNYGILKRDGIALMQTDHAALCMVGIETSEFAF